MKLKIQMHIVFWILVTVLLTVIFGRVFEDVILAFYFVSMLLPVAVGTSYCFNFILVPQFLLKKRYARFVLYFGYLLIVSTYLEMWVITGSLVLLVDLRYAALNPVVTDIFVLAIILYFIVFLKAFLLLIKRLFVNQERTVSLRAEKNKFFKGYLSVRVNRKQARILHKDILYIESLSDYVQIITESGDTIITRERIGRLAKELPGNFLRIHRSFIVNSQKVDFFSKTEVQVNGSTLPISRTYKKKVARKLRPKWDR